MNHLYVNDNFENEIVHKGRLFDYIVQGIHNLKREKNHNDFFCVCLPNNLCKSVLKLECREAILQCHVKQS